MPDFKELTIDVAAAAQTGGGFHGTTDLNAEPFCVQFNGVILPVPNVKTKHLELVTCQQCLEWIHA